MIFAFYLSGGGGHHGSMPKPQSSVNIPALAGIHKGKSLIEMATKGKITFNFNIYVSGNGRAFYISFT